MSRNLIFGIFLSQHIFPVKFLHSSYFSFRHFQKKSISPAKRRRNWKQVSHLTQKTVYFPICVSLFSQTEFYLIYFNFRPQPPQNLEFTVMLSPHFLQRRSLPSRFFSSSLSDESFCFLDATSLLPSLLLGLLR